MAIVDGAVTKVPVASKRAGSRVIARFAPTNVMAAELELDASAAVPAGDAPPLELLFPDKEEITSLADTTCASITCKAIGLDRAVENCS